MKSYEGLVASDPKLNCQDVCLPCPHCRRRYMGPIGGLDSHLHTAHDPDKGQADEAVHRALLKTDKAALTCDFCHRLFEKTLHLNAHLKVCPDNDSVVSSLQCPDCPKMFKTRAKLKSHKGRKHSKEWPCSLCSFVTKSSTEHRYS